MKTSALTCLACAVLLSACERPPMDSKQLGYRGLGMGQITDPRLPSNAHSVRVCVRSRSWDPRGSASQWRCRTT